MTSEVHPWISFYLHQGKDHKDRSLLDIWTFTYDELEKDNDFIHWLFPLPDNQQSPNTAPNLSKELITAIEQKSQVQQNLLRSYDILAAFWGFFRDDNHDIQPSKSFNERSIKWLCQETNCHAKMTQVLTFLTLTGHNQLSENTCAFLLSHMNQAGFSFSNVTAITHWMDAITPSNHLNLTEQEFDPPAQED